MRLAPLFSWNQLSLTFPIPDLQSRALASLHVYLYWLQTNRSKSTMSVSLMLVEYGAYIGIEVKYKIRAFRETEGVQGRL